MNQYYLIAQLPSLDFLSDAAPMPITEERFLELCSRYVGRKALKALKNLSLVPARQKSAVGFKLIDAWNEGERKLRLALAGVRAEKMKKSFTAEEKLFSAELLDMAYKAVEMDDPMAAEKFLNEYRLEFLESLRPMDAFSEDMLFYYGLKLKLILRIRAFDESIGRNAYRNIYDSIMHGDEQEVKE